MIGRHRRKRTTSTASYDAMLIRMIRAYRKRVHQDPDVALADLRAIESELADAVNLGLHDAIADGQSATQLAGILGVSRQAIYKRAGLGEQVARQHDRARPVTSTRMATPRELASSPTSEQAPSPDERECPGRARGETGQPGPFSARPTPSSIPVTASE